jgi:hypothetical protein
VSVIVDSSTPEQILPRSDVWRRQYDADRYARHLSQAELNQRIRDVVLNLLSLTAEGIGINPMEVLPGVVSNESTAWMEKWTHILEEMKLRYGPYPAGFTRDILHKEPLPDFVSELAKKAAKRLASIGSKPRDVFIKFGKRKYMERLYESGELRIQPATYFAETSHNEAIQDDELRLTLSFALSRDDLLALVVNPKDVPPAVPEHRANVKYEWPSDYWLYCVSSSVKARLFVDYNADSCVIIRDRGRFIEMLSNAVRHGLSSAAMDNGPVVYVDPLLPTTDKLFMPRVKHFKYTYQDEYRFCWLPTTRISKLTHMDVQIGSLRDFADFVVL